MKGIRFGDMHSWDDLKMILNSKEMGAPGVKATKKTIANLLVSCQSTKIYRKDFNYC